MEKLLYWLRKLGMLRTSSYKVKGDAQKLVDMDATDGGMIQSQKEIDEKYKPQDASGKDETVTQGPLAQATAPAPEISVMKGRILFSVFLVVGLLFLLMFLGVGFGVWFLVAAVLWVWLLRHVWVATTAGTLAFGKMMILGIALIFASFFFVDWSLPTSEELREEYKALTGEEYMTAEEKATATATDDTATVSEDQVTTFLRTLATETRINFSAPTSDKLIWPSTNIQLALTNGQSMGVTGISAEDIGTVEKFLRAQGATEATIGFEFVPPVGTRSSGLVINDGEYAHLMCIVLALEEDGLMVGCGWGPGGGE